MTGVGWVELKKPAHPLTPQMQRCSDLGLLDDLLGDKLQLGICAPRSLSCVSFVERCFLLNLVARPGRSEGIPIR